MGFSVFPAPSAGGKIAKKITLTGGSSWTVPTGVTDINVLLVGGGGGACKTSAGTAISGSGEGYPGETRYSTLTVTPGQSISYAIGGGGSAGNTNTAGAGGNTTMTGATTASGGEGGKFDNWAAHGKASFASNMGRNSMSENGTAGGGNGGSGWIEIEYWV